MVGPTYSKKSSRKKWERMEQGLPFSYHFILLLKQIIVENFTEMRNDTNPKIEGIHPVLSKIKKKDTKKKTSSPHHLVTQQILIERLIYAGIV